MNPYTFPVTCDTCGGEGMGTIQAAGAAWVRGSFVTHSDPRVCRDVLAAKERERKKHLRTPPPSDWAVPA